jgi:ABC-2 type transport system ATP-binding protein
MGDSNSGREHRTRRELLQGIGAIAAASVATEGALAADATVEEVAAAAGVQEDEYSATDVKIDSFDGTTIAATFWEPTTEGQFPAILATHGWGGDRTGAISNVAPVYAKNGYVGLTYDSRGFGESGGEVNLTSELEQQDTQALIDWLAEQESVLTEGAGNPRLGLDGASYGGGIQLRVASVDDRVDAMVPRATWHDLRRALDPNRVFKSLWAEGLLLSASNDDLASLFENVANSALDRGYTEPLERDFLETRSTPSYEGDIDAATLVIGGWYDTLFPANESVNNFLTADETEGETKLILNNDNIHTQFGGDPPANERSREHANQAALDWFDRHLKGEGERTFAKFTYYQEETDEFVEESGYPPFRDLRGPLRFSLSETATLDGPDADPMTFDYEVQKRTELVGTPVLSLEVRPTGEGRTNLMVALRRVRDGTAETLKRQITPYYVDEAGTLEFDMNGVAAVLEPGDTLRLALATASAPLIDPDNLTGRLPALEEIFVDTDDNAGVEILSTTDLTLQVPPYTSEDGSYYEDRYGPGMDLPAALAAVGGLGYLLKRRLDADESG